VVTGLRYDLKALLSSPSALFQLPMFLALFLLVRGLPGLLARHDLDTRSRVALGLVSATQLPLVVAIADIGVRSGRLQAETSASLVGAGMASVLVFPLTALALRRRRAPPPTETDSAELYSGKSRIA
jgi:Kef-type K+ transport system membrane component KefB